MSDAAIKMEQLSSDEQESEDFWQPFRKLFNSPSHSDIKLYLGKQRVPVNGHSLILKLRSVYFSCRLESLGPGRHGLYIGEREDVSSLWRMLQYIYTGDYETQMDQYLQKYVSETHNNLLIHIRLYVVAYEYGLTGLKDLCIKKLQADIHDKWDCAIFCESVRVLFSSDVSNDEDEMVQLITDAALAHASELLRSVNFLDMLEADARISAAFVRKTFSVIAQ